MTRQIHPEKHQVRWRPHLTLYHGGLKTNVIFSFWIVIAQPDTGTTLNITMSESFLNYKQLKRMDKISQYPSKMNPETDNLLMQRRPSRLSLIKAIKRVDSASNHSLTDSVSNTSTADTSLSEADIMTILNRFVFFLFLVFIIMLNVVCLVGLPYIIKEPLTMKEWERAYFIKLGFSHFYFFSFIYFSIHNNKETQSEHVKTEIFTLFVSN